MKKYFYILLSIFLISTGVHGQQDYQFTQFNFNKLAINPAYTGTNGVASITALYRQQWSGLEGAPSTFTFTGHSTVFDKKVGLGVLLFNDRLGVSNNMGLYTTYSYRIPVKKSVLSFGLQAGLLNFRSDLTEVAIDNVSDIAFSENINKFNFNFGAGLYWYMPNKAYAGISVPHLLNNNWSNSSAAPDDPVANLYRHIFIMGGYIVPINNNFKLRPSLLLKFAAGGDIDSPVNADFNLSLNIVEKIWVGVAYRLDDSFGMMLEYQITDQLLGGYSYDATLSELNSYNNGSHEIMLSYEFRYKNKKHINPRSIRYF